MTGKKEKPKSKKKRLKFPGWLKKKPYWVVALLAEGILLMLSVLFALVLNERRAEFQRTREAGVALEAIKSELQENIESLDRARSHHNFIRVTLLYYETQNELPPSDIYIKKGLFQPAYLFSTAWETSVQTGILDSEKALRDNFKNWSVITWDFSNREERLSDKLEMILSTLENSSTLE